MEGTDEEGYDSDETIMDETTISKSQQYRDIAHKWFKERDMDEITSLVEEVPDKNSFTVYLNVSSAVRTLYGFKPWVLFLNELIKLNKGFQKIYQKTISDSFVNMILGTKIGIKKVRITSINELYEAIKFLENNTPLKGPKVSHLRSKIQETISKKKITVNAWKRITSVLPGIEEEYVQLQEIKLKLSSLNMKKKGSTKNSESLPKISASKIRKQIRKCKNIQDKICIEIYENLLFKNRIKSRMTKREIIANLSFLYGLRSEYNYDLAQEFLSISKQIYLSLKKRKKAAECQFNSLKIFYLKEAEVENNYIAIRSLEIIKKQFAIKQKGHLFIVSSRFLVKSFLDMYHRFEKKSIYGIAEDCLDNMQLLIENMKEKEDLFFQLYNSKIKDKRVELRKATPKIVFVFDTSFLCYIFELFSVEEERRLKEAFRIISDFFHLYTELQYVATTDIIGEIPKRFRDYIRMIEDIIHFQKYKIDHQQIENLKIINAMYTRRTFDAEEVSDYVIIQTAVNHKSSENIVIIVSNDEGIHRYCKKELPSKRISVIWCHSLIEFISKKEKIEKDSRKLHDLSTKMKNKLERYRKENKRKKIEKYPVEELLLSLDLEK